METKFDPRAKINQGDLGTAPEGKQPNQEAINIDFDKHAPGKGKSQNYLDLEKSGEYLTKSGSEHVQDSLFKLADQKDY